MSHSQRFHSCLLTLAAVALASACSGSGPACSHQSSSSSGGICRTDVLCGSTELAASCTDTECSCLRSGTATGTRFPADGFCAASEAEQTRRVAASCLSGAADGGSTADAGALAPYCATSPIVAGATCVSSAEGDRCPANIYCDMCARNVPTTCVCTSGAAGFAFVCADPCASCAGTDGGTLPMPDGSTATDAGAAGTACLAGPQCTESTDGSTSSIELIASVCAEVGGSFVADCVTAGRDSCVVATLGIVLYSDRSAAGYDAAASEKGCQQLGGVFTP